jgi:hypothetical protein
MDDKPRMPRISSKSREMAKNRTFEDLLRKPAKPEPEPKVVH